MKIFDYFLSRTCAYYAFGLLVEHHSARTLKIIQWDQQRFVGLAKRLNQWKITVWTYMATAKLQGNMNRYSEAVDIFGFFGKHQAEIPVAHTSNLCVPFWKLSS